MNIIIDDLSETKPLTAEQRAKIREWYEMPITGESVRSLKTAFHHGPIRVSPKGVGK